jgi:hypothetical protein
MVRLQSELLQNIDMTSTGLTACTCNAVIFRVFVVLSGSCSSAGARGPSHQWNAWDEPMEHGSQWPDEM